MRVGQLVFATLIMSTACRPPQSTAAPTAMAPATRPETPSVVTPSPEELVKTVVGALPLSTDRCDAAEVWSALDGERALREMDDLVAELAKTGDQGIDRGMCLRRAAALRFAQRARVGALNLDADLRTDVPALRRAAAGYIEVTGAKQALPALRELLASSDPKRQRDAIEAITRLRDRESLPRLVELSKSNPPDPRKLEEPYARVDEKGVRHVGVIPDEVSARIADARMLGTIQQLACRAVIALGEKCDRQLPPWPAVPAVGPRSKRPPTGECAVMRSRLRRGADVSKTLDDFVQDRFFAMENTVQFPAADMSRLVCPLPGESLVALAGADRAIRGRLALVQLWGFRLKGARSYFPHLQLPVGFEAILDTERDSERHPMSFTDPLAPPTTVAYDQIANAKSFDARLIEGKRVAHPEHRDEIVQCYRVKMVSRATRTTHPVFHLFDSEGFDYTRIDQVQPALGRLCAPDAGPRFLAAGESAEIWAGFHLPPDAQPTRLRIYVSDHDKDLKEIFDTVAISVTRN